MIRGCENWASMDSEANNENLTLSFLRLQLSKRAEAGWLLHLALKISAASLQMSWRKLQQTLGKVSVRAAHFTVRSFCRCLTGYINLSRQPGRWDFKPEFSQIRLAKYSRTNRRHLGRKRRKLWPRFRRDQKREATVRSQTLEHGSCNDGRWRCKQTHQVQRMWPLLHCNWSWKQNKNMTLCKCTEIAETMRKKNEDVCQRAPRYLTVSARNSNRDGVSQSAGALGAFKCTPTGYKWSGFTLWRVSLCGRSNSDTISVWKIRNRHYGAFVSQQSLLPRSPANGDADFKCLVVAADTVKTLNLPL